MTTEFKSIECFRKEKQIPNLDGLRAVAILLVLVHHLPPIPLPFLKNFQLNAGSGVALFFIISGFLICTLALREVRETGKFSLWNFYVRRSLRLLPLYYAVLAVVCFLVFYLNVYTPERRELFAEQLPSYLFYYSNLKYIGGPFSLVWSLAVEEQFYFIFSILFFFCKKKVAGLIFFGLLILQLQPFISYNPDYLITNLISRMFFFFVPIFMGVLLAYAFESPLTFSFFQKTFNNPFVLVCSVLGILFYLFNHFDNANLYYGALTLLVGICALSPPLPFIGGRLMSHIGKISYGIYLIHTIIFFGIKDVVGLNPFLIFFLGTPIVIISATLIYNYFEKPILSCKKKFYVAN